MHYPAVGVRHGDQPAVVRPIGHLAVAVGDARPRSPIVHLLLASELPQPVVAVPHAVLGRNAADAVIRHRIKQPPGRVVGVLDAPDAPVAR
jgi:hypothetical protein